MYGGEKETMKYNIGFNYLLEKLLAILVICSFSVHLFANTTTSDMAFADYNHEPLKIENKLKVKNLYGLKIEALAEQTLCRSLPFLATSKNKVELSG